MLDATKVAALKTLGFSDTDIAGLQAQAQATEKAADEQQVAYKADEPPAEPVELPDLVINGVTYKALPPPPPAMTEVTKDDGEGDMEVMTEGPMEEEAVGGLTLSPEDLQAIGEAIQAGIAQVMGALDLEKKVASHVQGFMQPYTAQKDSEAAERDEKIAQLEASLKSIGEQHAATKAQLDELMGLQPAVKADRPSEAQSTLVNPWIPNDQHLLQAIKDQAPAGDFQFGDLVQNLFGNQTPGQA